MSFNVSFQLTPFYCPMILGVKNSPKASGILCHLETSEAADPSYEFKKSEERALQAPLLRQPEGRAPHFSSAPCWCSDL